MAVKKKLSEKENQYRKELLDYILQLYVNNGWDYEAINFAMIASQIKHITEQNINCGWILYTLQYMNELEDVDLFDTDTGSVLNLVPYYYPQAKQFWNKTKAIKELVENSDIDDREVKVNVTRNDIRNFRFIPIDF